MKELISVIVPVYNVEDYLDECIQSVIRQSYKNLEIILVDDGSTDSCGSLCDKYPERDKRIKVVHKANGGLSDARNAGLEIATGDYIAFVDSDDFIDETMYAELHACFTTCPEAIIVSSPLKRTLNNTTSIWRIGRVDYEDGKSISINDYMRLFLSFQIDNSVCNKLFKREFIQSGFKKGRNNEDYLFMYYNCKRWYSSDAKLTMCSKPYYNYRLRGNSICHQDRNIMNPLLIDMAYNCEEILEDLREWKNDLFQIVWSKLESVVLKAKGQMILYPKSKIVYPRESDYINSLLWNKLSLFKKRTSLLNRVKIIIFRFIPFVWKLKSQQK